MFPALTKTSPYKTVFNFKGKAVIFEVSLNVYQLNERGHAVPNTLLPSFLHPSFFPSFFPPSPPSFFFLLSTSLPPTLLSSTLPPTNPSFLPSFLLPYLLSPYLPLSPSPSFLPSFLPSFMLARMSNSHADCGVWFMYSNNIFAKYNLTSCVGITDKAKET